MVEYRRRQGVLASSSVVSIGIDVHKDSWHVTALVAGEAVFRGGIPATYEALRQLLDRFVDCEIRVAYEAGPCGFSLYDQLDNDHIHCVVAAPSLIPVESGNRVKTDRRDSFKLADLLEAGKLKGVFVLSEEERAHRDLVRTRRQLVEHRADLMRQVKAKLLFHSLKPPCPGRAFWSRRYVEAVRTMEYPTASLRAAVGALLEALEFVTKQITVLGREIVALSRTDAYRERVRLLLTIPGIGLLTAMEILTELGDVTRFPTNEHLASFLGLTPSEYSSGPFVRQGRITRCGNVRIRSALVESAWYLVRRDPALGKKFNSLKRIKGAKRAIVAIARKLSARIRHVLVTGEPYVVGRA